MTNEEKAYIAGIIDGEGSIMLTSFHRNELHSPCVSIASTTLELLQWIKDKTNTGVIKRKKNYNTERHKDCFSYTLRYNDAINFLEMISPYLVIESKKRRALMIINEYKSLTPRNGRYSEELLEKKREFYERFIALK
ncbi:LAGLIDADG family homing endonuclease [Clostridium sp. YIM B02505]|uniref:LAGLIDADG family homing endonuclease n=1 Tax=Clostridium yunnanense TaxID=2800325 RepID=A0ABS1EK21_9CLOT|nr:LAGLIDADG family homing endonuclease [Clostridium yunnanense]MBK1809711.1 LAGLIDADG family homing endonuclease [Clostridium yunnanense]